MHQFCVSIPEFGSLTTSQLMEKVRGLQNLAYQLGLEEGRSTLCLHVLHPQTEHANGTEKCAELHLKVNYFEQ